MPEPFGKSRLLDPGDVSRIHDTKRAMERHIRNTAGRPVIDLSQWDITVTQTYETHRCGLTAAASRIVGRDHAADVAQDAFVRVWSHPQSYDEQRGTLTKYLYMVVRGVAIDRLRAMTSQRLRDAQNAVHSPTSTMDESMAAIMTSERSDRVREAMSRLRVVEREAILAAFFGNLTYREVAAQLGLPEGTVKSRIRLGLLRLRSDLREIAVA